jgi:purine-binding chemotaxis protein CheW
MQLKGKDMKQALIFKLDGCEYAIDSQTLIKIDRKPELTPVSYAPESILGLCSTEGQIIPVFDTLHLLINQTMDIDKSEVRSLILTHDDKLISLMVEEVIGNIDVDELSIEYIDNSRDGVVGFMKYNESVVQILSLDFLINSISIVSLERKEKKQNSSKKSEVKKSKHLHANQYLVFNMQDEKFAILIDKVREIIISSRQMISIANSPDEVLGLITLREDVIPVIDLRIHFSKEALESEKNRILIVHTNGSLVGLLVDSIEDIVDIYDTQMEELSAKFRDEKVSAIAKQDSNLTTVLSNNHLLTLAQQVQSYMQNDNNSESTLAKRDYENYDEVVIFKLQEEEFAIDIDDILEIVRYEGFTDIPISKEYILGMINLRGEIIPVVSLMTKLGLKESRFDEGNILISRVNGSKVGFFVESVSDIVNIPLNIIKENSDNKNIFSHTILLDNGERMILKMAIDNLFLEEELKLEIEEAV